MGYSTDFNGQIKLSRPATVEEIAYLNAFSETRRMRRNADITQTFTDPVRDAVGLPIGIDGGFYVGNTVDFGQTRTADIIDYNRPPVDQPSLWCQWVLTEDGNFLEWDGGEKFYQYVEWMKYLIDNFFSKWDIVLNGSIQWEGEDRGDFGTIYVTDNVVTTVWD